MIDEDKVIANKLQLDWEPVLDNDRERMINSESVSVVFLNI